MSGESSGILIFGRSGNFGVYAGSDEYQPLLEVRQLYIQETNANNEVVRRVRLAPFDKSYPLTPGRTDKISSMASFLFKKKIEFRAGTNGNMMPAAKPDDDVTFELFVAVNGSSEDIAENILDPFTSDEVTLQPKNLKFSIRINNWTCIEADNVLSYSISLRNLDGTAVPDVNDDNNNSFTLGGVSLTFQTTDAAKVTMEGSVLTVTFANDGEPSLVKSVTYDPTLAVDGSSANLGPVVSFLQEEATLTDIYNLLEKTIGYTMDQPTVGGYLGEGFQRLEFDGGAASAIGEISNHIPSSSDTTVASSTDMYGLVVGVLVVQVLCFVALGILVGFFYLIKKINCKIE